MCQQKKCDLETEANIFFIQFRNRSKPPYFVNTISENDFIFSKSENIIIIGQGNVAMDCARILAGNINKLSQTDITNHSIETFSTFKNRIKNIYIICRRGMVQSSFTNKELREVICGDMNEDCIATINEQEMVTSMNELSKQELDNSRAIQRKISIYEGAEFDNNYNNCNNYINFRFLLSPQKFIGDENGRVKSFYFGERFNGGFRSDSNDKLMRIDDTQHCVCALMKLNALIFMDKNVKKKLNSYSYIDYNDPLINDFNNQNMFGNEWNLIDCGFFSYSDLIYNGNPLCDAQIALNIFSDPFEDTNRGKETLYEERLKAGMKLSLCFGDQWDGPNYFDKNVDEFKDENEKDEWYNECYQKSIEFIKKAFLSQNKNEKITSIFTHITTATDQNNIEFVFTDVGTGIIQRNLAKIGVAY